MNKPENTNQTLARLVLFMVGLAIAGTFVAGAHYYAVDLPQHMNPQAPTNQLCYEYHDNTCNWICSAIYCGNSRTTEPELGGYSQYKCIDRAGFDNCMATKECHSRYPPCPPSSPCNDCRYTCDVQYEFCPNSPGYTMGDCAGIRDTCYSACPCG